MAENRRAFAVIAPWVFAFLKDQSMNQSPPIIVPDPDKLDVGRWTKGQLTSWLLERRLDVSADLRKKELATIVRRYLLSSNCPELVEVRHRGVVTAKTIRQMHQQVSRYCQSLMAIDLVGIPAANRTLAHAMSYLNLLDDSYKTLRNKTECNLWMQMYTLLGILRAPTHFHDYIWIRSLYEGGDMGEGVVKHLRPLSPTGVKINWSFHIVEGYYRRLTMSFLQDYLSPKAKDVQQVKVDQRSYVRFGTRADIRDKIENKVVLSILIYENTRESELVIGSMIIQCKQHYLCEYSISDMPVFEDQFGFVYFKLELTKVEHKVTHDTVKSLKLVKTGFALPLISVVDPTLTGYCVVSDDGDCLDNQHSLQSTV